MLLDRFEIVIHFRVSDEAGAHFILGTKYLYDPFDLIPRAYNILVLVWFSIIFQLLTWRQWIARGAREQEPTGLEVCRHFCLAELSQLVKLSDKQNLEEGAAESPDVYGLIIIFLYEYYFRWSVPPRRHMVRKLPNSINSQLLLADKFLGYSELFLLTFDRIICYQLSRILVRDC